ncbi:Oxysterol-binding protein-domain-containing protein [Annulohypoxylon truncatum]|uniref:Oxysterol-binding protein-domain-containing protein n=1 Tax=Annulohypoxylon truncatum TaxID=327061 RepID=UPI002007B1A5|nr:Oxysterol-binding protein-domain-containing protein [Annulohypoxylon truncatum]KAI1207281.1 Oxysterol-binding protein-domain-containing protein [Annulohypoxylon truncatum]
MAGIEQLEIHSKSYIVRWVKVDEGQTISWSVQPHKKSINFGIVKHPGSGATNNNSALDSLNASVEHVDGSGGQGKKGFGKKDASTAQEQLANKGFIPIKWLGKCEADKVSMGTWDVLKNNGGMYGLIFDNTFSKQTSKTATFVLLTYPTGAPPQGAHYLPNLQAGSQSNASKTSLGKHSPSQGAAAADSNESLPITTGRGQRAKSISARSDGTVTSSTYTGILLKRRRKKGQGYARRFFSLDYSSCTLSYYHNRQSSALRGAIPLSLAAIAADERRREINIDSGAEVWHLRAASAKEFNDWAHALEKASRIARGLDPVYEESVPKALTVATPSHTSPSPSNAHHEEDREWQQVEALVSRIVGTRDALRRLVKDMAQKQAPRPQSSHLSQASPAMSENSDGYFTPAAQDKRPFWKRKPSNSPLAPDAMTPPALAVPTPGSVSTATPNGARKTSNPEQGEENTHEHCTALLNDLDSVVSEFTKVLANSKRRRIPVPPSATSRKSLESTASTDEFFDAEGGEMESRPQVMMIDRRESDEDSHGSEADEAEIDDTSSVSSIQDEEPTTASGAAALFPIRPKSLHPLPVDIAVDRRKTIPPATVPPPSLIAFFRKNVGKDLSTISMPVSSNEPISALQRVAEQLEYAQLLDQASQQKAPKDRLLLVTAFAISHFSVNRVKERAMRKPFNPLLGETFELLRTESEVPGGFRLLVEKVTHRPVRLAMHADAAAWSLTQSPAPSQKFWGKSAELNTEGRVRLTLRLLDGTDELYSWNMATMFLRNVVMGEKYVEPVGIMTVCNDSTGAKANIEFKTKGMFGGRSEDVEVDCCDASGSSMGYGLVGNWTSSLRVVEGGKATKNEIWKAGSVVPNAPNTYGLTSFSATLNETTQIEKGRLPPTDTRLRPDQRLAEEGKLDEAEESKVLLEEAQRARRRDMEEKGEQYKPRWFVKVPEAPDGEELWRMKLGKESYWEERSKGEWKGIERIFEVAT